MLYQHDTEEDEGLKGVVYPQPLTLLFIRMLFHMVIYSIQIIFASDYIFLEMGASLILQRLCVLLNANSTYIWMAKMPSNHNNTITARIYLAWN